MIISNFAICPLTPYPSGFRKNFLLSSGIFPTWQIYTVGVISIKNYSSHSGKNKLEFRVHGWLVLFWCYINKTMHVLFKRNLSI